MEMNKYEEALKKIKSALEVYSPDFLTLSKEDEEDLGVLQKACKKAQLYDERLVDPLYKETLWKLINVNLHDVEKQQCIDEIIQDLNTIEKHKQIEKELGIELVTLFKALKDRKELWIKPFKDKEPINIFDKDIPFIQSPQLAYIPDKFGYEWIINTSITLIYLKDYGNTWALTKEELENE